MVNYWADKAVSKKSRVFQKFLPNLNMFNLKNCKLYNNTYKKHFIDLINKYKTQYKEDADIYNKLLEEL